MSSASGQTVPAERKSIQEVAMVCVVRRVSSYRGVMRNGLWRGGGGGGKRKERVTE